MPPKKKKSELLFSTAFTHKYKITNISKSRQILAFPDLQSAAH
jgi:hypothetical protein